MDDIVRSFLARVKIAPNDELLKVAITRENAVQRKALQTAQEQLEKAKREYTALEEEAVKALTGESTYPVDFINSLIPKRRDALMLAQQEMERIVLEKQMEDEAFEASQLAISRAKDWAEKYDSANLETKRMILANLINRVEVERDY